MVNDEEEIKARRALISSYSDYITVTTIKIGYAHVIKRVEVKKDIPIQLTKDEICEYADDWNWCFGGTILPCASTEDADVYEVKIYTD